MVKHNMTGPDRHQKLVEVMSLATLQMRVIIYCSPSKNHPSLTMQIVLQICTTEVV